MVPDHKQKALITAKKAHSHINKVVKMLEQDAYCIDIMQQILAVQGLLKSLNQTMLKGHFQTCFRSAMEGKIEKRKQAAIAEVLRIVSMNSR